MTDSRTPGARLPIIPVQWQRENIRGTVRQLAGLYWHKSRYHGVRAPWYTVNWAWCAAVGAKRITGRILAWWHWTDGWVLESQAVAAGRPGHRDAMQAHQQG